MLTTQTKEVDMSEGIYMSEKEINRAKILQKIEDKKLTQVAASKELGISERQTRRLYNSFKRLGFKGICSKARGKPSNHRMPAFMVARIKELITSELYRDFGPTFMKEKLEERHEIRVSKETVRGLMIEEGLWTVNKKKRPVIHQQRQRRARRGELLQVDASPHAWFESRREKCALIVFIDDATGQTFGRFFESENAIAYMTTLQEYITKYGKPIALYSDKHGIFRINKPGCIRGENLTQFGRALEELKIQLICANSPQAKGRVERANQTLQDRLIKELRIAGISTIEEANQFLEIFWDVHNQKFAKTPEKMEDVHRPIGDVDLSKILCEKYRRKVSKNLEIQFEHAIYQIITHRQSRELIGAEISVIKTLNKELFLEYKGKSLVFKKFKDQIASGQEVSSKEIDRFLNTKLCRPRPTWCHKWSQEARALARKKAYQS